MQVIWVIESEFGQITVALELLERSPNQCELKIQAENTLSSRLIDKDLKDAASRLMKDSCFINHDLKMLKKIIKTDEPISKFILELYFHTISTPLFPKSLNCFSFNF
nr:F-box/FBD/LRR-repeat protein At1g13570-like [Ipomoea batatas]